VTRYITEQDMKELCHELAVALFDKYDEPIPPFELHEPGKLKAILANPMQTFGGSELYPTLNEKATILYYGLIKGHAFGNGNKRVATATLLVFLFINHYWMDISKSDLEKRAINTAESDPADMKNVINDLLHWIDVHRIDLPSA